MRYAQMQEALKRPETAEQLIWLYGSRKGTVEEQTARCQRTLARHEEAFHQDGAPVYLISAPGRTEIGGNHTDHNGGKVLCASVNLDVLCAVSRRDDLLVHLHSEGYRPLTVDLGNLTPQPRDRGTTAGLIRGVAARMHALGYPICGFDAAATSSVASGSGLSSSAAFEVMVAEIFSVLCGGDKRPDIQQQAMIGQYAENVFFGKPSGLLDQMASASGGLTSIDFRRKDSPEVKRLSYNFEEKGYALVVVGTGGSHANLTPFYSAIPAEMRQVADFFGQERLRDVPEKAFEEGLSQLYRQVPDRAILRAMHFYQENRRVDRQVQALEQDDLDLFFDAIIESGRSSYMYLQNVYAHVEDQSLGLALCMAEEMLRDQGAWRVHGGGFAGTTLNFVPFTLLDSFIAQMSRLFGSGCCHVLNIRPVGAYSLKL